MATVLRGPLITPSGRRRPAPDFQPPNRLLTALAIVTIAKVSAVVPVERLEAQQPAQASSFRGLLEASPTPFAQRQWDNPVRRVARAQPDPGGTLYGKTLTVVDLNGGRSDLSFQVDETKRRDRQIHYQQVTSLALNADVGASPFTVADWPMPLERREVRSQLLWRMVADAPEATPFTLSDWPQTPRLRLDQAEVPANTLPLAELVALPFQTEFLDPLPRLEKLEAHALATIIYEPAVPDPFHLTEWPGRQVKRPIDVEQRASALAGPLNTAQTFPFALTEWPVVRKVARFQETPQPNLQSLLYVVPTPPFKQTDWPTAELKFVREDHNRTNLIGTLPPPEIPFALDDWPNPLRKQDPHFDVWGQSLQHTTLFVENVKPFNQTDWNVGFLFDPQPYYQFVSYQPKVIIEGIGEVGLQPPTYVEGRMHLTHAIRGAINARGIGLDGEMQHTFGVDGSFDETDGFEGPV